MITSFDLNKTGFSNNDWLFIKTHTFYMKYIKYDYI